MLQKQGDFLAKWNVSYLNYGVVDSVRLLISNSLTHFSEKDIDEVLQTHTVFTNVSKGQAAKKEELVKAFGKADDTEICKEILAKGELQISEKERANMIDSTFNSVATNIASLCINPETRRPYPVSIIEKSLKDVHFSVKMNKNAKQQTLEAIKLLKESMPIERARMKLSITFQGKESPKLKENLLKLAASTVSEDWDGPTLRLVILIDPGHFRQIDEMVRNETKGKGLMELMELKEVLEGEEVL